MCFPHPAALQVEGNPPLPPSHYILNVFPLLIYKLFFFCITFPFLSVTECTKDQHLLCTMYARSIIGKDRWLRSFYHLHLRKVSRFYGTHVKYRIYECTRRMSLIIYWIFSCFTWIADAGIAYLMLLNADYDKSARSKCIADEVDYTLSVDSTECLVWDGVKDWRSDGCSVLESFTATKVNCRSGTILYRRKLFLVLFKYSCTDLAMGVYIGMTN